MKIKKNKIKKEAHSTHTFDLPIDDVKRWLVYIIYSLWVNVYFYTRLLHIKIHKDGRRYNAVQYDTILHTVLQWLQKNINQSFNFISQYTPNSWPTWVSYGVSKARILEKIDRAKTAPRHTDNIPIIWFDG